MGALAESSAAFSYDPTDEYGPANWYKLDIDGNACAGNKNSPIAVETTSCDRYENYRFVVSALNLLSILRSGAREFWIFCSRIRLDISFQNGSCSATKMTYELTNTGVKASYPGIQSCQNPSVQIPGLAGTYRALQFHIHSSSEHTINGKHFGAELHTVHQEVDGDRYAVVGMMIDPSAETMNEVFQQLLDGWAFEMDSNQDQCAISRGGDRKLEEKNTSRRLASDGPFSPYMLIPRGSSYYHYDGGLTTPPCSEVVWWNLADTPVSITPAQYQQLTDQILNYTDLAKCEPGTAAGPAGSTSRPPQPLNGRYVERICPVGFDDGESSSSTISMAAMGAAAVAGAAMLF